MRSKRGKQEIGRVPLGMERNSGPRKIWLVMALVSDVILGAIFCLACLHLSMHVCCVAQSRGLRKCALEADIPDLLDLKSDSASDPTGTNDLNHSEPQCSYF